MNPGYLSFILFLLFFTLAFYHSDRGITRQYVLSFKRLSVLSIVLLISSLIEIKVLSSSVNVGSFVMPLFIFFFIVISTKQYRARALISLAVVGTLVVCLNELMHAAPIAIFAPIHVMIAALAGSVGNLLVPNKLIGMLSCWAGIVVGDAAFQLVHYEQIPGIIFGDMASLDLLFLTSAVFISFLYAYELLILVLKRRETSG